LEESAGVPVLRLLSYNVRSLRDDPAAVARVIRSAQPDVVCVQEAPRFLRWRSRCAALARSSGLVVVGGGRVCGANLLLSTLGVDVVATREVAFSKDRGLHQRGTALALLQVGGARVAVAGTHLDYPPDAGDARLRHARELLEALDGFAAGVPTVIAGDVNDLPGSPTWQLFETRGTDAFAAAGAGDGFTYSALEPVRRIDGIFADARIGVRSAVVLDGDDVRRASDHRPVLAELEPA
jgi:endonuclease/exonuclease/phosphatase family metal-dependent hydrolase